MLPSITDKNVLLDRRDLTAAGAAATDFVDFGPVPYNHIWEVWEIAVLNDTSDTHTAQVQIVRGGQTFPLDWFVMTTHAILYSTGGLFLVPEGCTLRIVFAATAADVVHAFINGVDHLVAEKTPVLQG